MQIILCVADREHLSFSTLQFLTVPGNRSNKQPEAIRELKPRPRLILPPGE